MLADMLLRLWACATAAFLMLAGARRRRYRDGDVSLVYYCIAPKRRPAGGAAAPEPWLLLHGLGSFAVTWYAVLRALRRDCRLIVPELSALGGTRAPGGALDVEQGALLAARLIELELGGGGGDQRQAPVTVAGLSLGGWMAVRLAIARPDLVGRLVLIDAAGYRDQDWKRIAGLVRVDDLAGVDRLYGALFRTTPGFMRRARRGFLRAYTSPGVRHVLHALRERDAYAAADLARLPMPVALVWGEHDGLFRLETARAMAAAIPGAHLQVLGNCGHAVHMECPRDLVAALERVRRELPPVRPATPETPETIATRPAPAAAAT
jgi:pimeloyl-ACP methyl ester carboxylesterase